MTISMSNRSNRATAARTRREPDGDGLQQTLFAELSGIGDEEFAPWMLGPTF